MKKVLDAVNDFKGHVLSPNEMIRVKTFLNTTFPEAEWDVVYDSYGSINLIPTFKNDEEKTFYTIKWS